MRQRFLLEELGKWGQYMEGEINDPPYGSMAAILDELEEYSRPEPVAKSGDITKEMRDQAKAVPIDKVVKFVRGTAVCFNHPDKSPSMYHGTRINKAICPVCAKSWDTIDVLVCRDGMSYANAVRELCNV